MGRRWRIACPRISKPWRVNTCCEDAARSAVSPVSELHVGSNFLTAVRISTEIKNPLDNVLQCSIHTYTPLSIKHFHGVLAGNGHECSLKPSIEKVSSLSGSAQTA